MVHLVSSTPTADGTAFECRCGATWETKAKAWSGVWREMGRHLDAQPELVNILGGHHQRANEEGGS